MQSLYMDVYVHGSGPSSTSVWFVGSGNSCDSQLQFPASFGATLASGKLADLLCTTRRQRPLDSGCWKLFV